ncbi:hypothetical protein ACV3QH_08585 [Clostridium perfringens]
MATKKLLVVSNDPISKTSNNGKTIASFIDEKDKNYVRQLYFSTEKPSVKGYLYYQLSDKDVLKGIFRQKQRGRACEAIDRISQLASEHNHNKIKRNAFTRILREFLWSKNWKSKQLIKWLDEYKPDVVFFVAGDSGFAYKIVNFIVNRYKSRLVTYITDDYIMPRNKENMIEKIRRKYIRKKMLNCIEESDEYFTISTLMQDAYYKLSGKKSNLMINITSSLKMKCDFGKLENKNINIIYTGSLYYNRDKTIGLVAEAVSRYNEKIKGQKKHIEISVYSNIEPDIRSKQKFVKKNICEYRGSLNPEELKYALNRADILLFVESFDEEMKEKTKYSLSTKVPEYMSVGKPILAIGPNDIGSMNYLNDVAFCANSEEKIYSVIQQMLSSHEAMNQKARLAIEKFNNNHNAVAQKKLFMDICRI